MSAARVDGEYLDVEWWWWEKGEDGRDIDIDDVGKS